MAKLKFCENSQQEVILLAVENPHIYQFQILSNDVNTRKVVGKYKQQIQCFLITSLFGGQQRTIYS